MDINLADMREPVDEGEGEATGGVCPERIRHLLQIQPWQICLGISSNSDDVVFVIKTNNIYYIPSC